MAVLQNISKLKENQNPEKISLWESAIKYENLTSPINEELNQNVLFLFFLKHSINLTFEAGKFPAFCEYKRHINENKSVVEKYLNFACNSEMKLCFACYKRHY